jgi:hypothetical protein
MAFDPIPSWNADEWSAFGNVLLGVGAVTAGVWTLFNYRKNRRAEAARWLQGVSRDFYLDDRFRPIKLVMEYDYTEKLGPLLERRVTDADVPVTAEETDLTNIPGRRPRQTRTWISTSPSPSPRSSTRR